MSFLILEKTLWQFAVTISSLEVFIWDKKVLSFHTCPPSTPFSVFPRKPYDQSYKFFTEDGERCTGIKCQGTPGFKNRK